MSTETETYISALMEKARIAQAAFSECDQDFVHDVCGSIAWELYRDENIRALARLAVEETAMGIYEHKISKHKNKVLGALRDILQPDAKTVGLIEYDAAKGIRKYAKPIGVIGALTPVTNPTATPASNAVSILKGRNAVIFAPHPHAKRATALAVDFMRKGLRRVGAPEDLIQVIPAPTPDLTNELMRQADLVVATGGGAMVKAAYSSGKPAFGVGPGNSCQIIAEDADLEDAAAKIRQSKCFDNATSCSSENSIVIQDSVYQKMVDALVSRGGYLCNAEERARLKAYMWVLNKKGTLAINSEIVARSAEVIAQGAGIEVPAGTSMLLVEGEMPLEEDLFAEENLSPVLTLWDYQTFQEGYEILKRLTDHSGRGHSCGIHTFNQDYIEFLGLHMNLSRIMVRQAQASANGGNFQNGMPSTTTLGCGTWGNNITTENINYKHFINITWLSEPIGENRPTDSEIWDEFFKKYRK